jgi:formate hydrogenlyase transcriptional activator
MEGEEIFDALLERQHRRAGSAGVDVRENGIVGESEVIRRVCFSIDQVAPTGTTVLILGETGTGKELAARAIHARSARSDRPLLTVNCSALPSGLIESELFGHENGAFTGATARQIGRFELADRGTIFLDEIGDLPLRLQPRLLRVLQEGEFERLGSGQTIKADVRVIAATNRNLADAMQRGRFRHDLYYRLNVYPITLPPLRERREDIPMLAEGFLQEAGRRLGRSFEPIAEEVLVSLTRHEWPGNIRELKNVIDRSAVISEGSRLELPRHWADSTRHLPRTFELGRPTKVASRAATLKELQRSHILRVMQQTGWRVEGPRGAARILGLYPSTLRSRMLKLGIRKESRKDLLDKHQG